MSLIFAQTVSLLPAEQCRRSSASPTWHPAAGLLRVSHLLGWSGSRPVVSPQIGAPEPQVVRSPRLSGAEARAERMKNREVVASLPWGAVSTSGWSVVQVPSAPTFQLHLPPLPVLLKTEWTMPTHRGGGPPALVSGPPKRPPRRTQESHPARCPGARSPVRSTSHRGSQARTLKLHESRAIVQGRWALSAEQGPDPVTGLAGMGPAWQDLSPLRDQGSSPCTPSAPGTNLGCLPTSLHARLQSLFVLSPERLMWPPCHMHWSPAFLFSKTDD